MKSPKHESYAATIGVFDGVHTGHRFLLQQLHDESVRRGLRSMVVTFGIHPAEALGRPVPPLLTTTEERRQALGHLRDEGLIDSIVVLEDVKDIMTMTAEGFMTMLKERFGVAMVLMGYDHRFGCEQSADTAFYREAGKRIGIEVARARVSDAAEGFCPQSTVIRRLLAEGHADEAATLLGRPYTLQGEVVHGDQRGRKIGFPTANLHVDSTKLLPMEGVYAATALLPDGTAWPAMLYLGHRPTFKGNDEQRVEAHLIGFDGDLYGLTLSVDVQRFVRGERKFRSANELALQLEQDRTDCLLAWQPSDK